MKFSAFEKTMISWAILLVIGFTLSQFITNKIILTVIWTPIVVFGIVYMIKNNISQISSGKLILWIMFIVVGFIITLLNAYAIFLIPYKPHIFWVFLCGVAMTFIGILDKDTYYTFRGFGLIFAGIAFSIINAPIFLAGYFLAGFLTYKIVIKYISYKFSSESNENSAETTELQNRIDQQMLEYDQSQILPVQPQVQTEATQVVENPVQLINNIAPSQLPVKLPVQTPRPQKIIEPQHMLEYDNVNVVAENSIQVQPTVNEPIPQSFPDHSYIPQLPNETTTTVQEQTNTTNGELT